MSESPAQTGSYDVVCPHCNREFNAELLQGSAARYNGFKCPHCKLFVPVDRVEDEATKT
jgi:phage FluMu protein Com